MSFLIGCNYWASNAGIEMWRQFDADVIRRDFKELKSYGIDYLRVFPLWRDFQIAEPFFGGSHSDKHVYLDKNGLYSKRDDYLDEDALHNFSIFCDIAKEEGMKLIVGLITGWMSGRLYTPDALFNKNLFTDPLALFMEQKFISGFVKEFKDRDSVYAWDLGNECNCMDRAENKFEVENWIMVVANAIRVADSKKPIVAGTAMLAVSDNWRITDMAAHTDVLTTHPYPLWTAHSAQAEISSQQILLNATCQTKFNTDLGKKPCLVEEIGTMGPMVCDNETASYFLRVNFYSNWLYGATGLMWWCAFDQKGLNFPPYENSSCEVELGLFERDYTPKPMLTEMKKFHNFLDKYGFELSAPVEDGVILLTDNQDQWGVGFSSFVLAKQAGLNLKIAYNELPDSDLYLLPSINRFGFMSATMLEALKTKVKNGATLYLSLDDCIIYGFEELTGMRVITTKEEPFNETFEFNGKKITAKGRRKYNMKPVGASVLSSFGDNVPLMSKFNYGKGTVVLLNFPMEANLIDSADGFENDYFEIYRSLIDKRIVEVDDKKLGVTLHPTDNGYVVAVVNYSVNEITLNLTLCNEYKFDGCIYGDIKTVKPCEMTLIKISRKK